MPTPVAAMTWIRTDLLDCLHCAYLAAYEDVASGWTCPLCGCTAKVRVSVTRGVGPTDIVDFIEVERAGGKTLLPEIKAAYRLGGIGAVLCLDASTIGNGLASRQGKRIRERV